MRKLTLALLLIASFSAFSYAVPAQQETDIAALQSNSMPALQQLSVRIQKTKQVNQEVGDLLAETLLLRSQNPDPSQSQALARAALALGLLDHDRYRTALTQVAKTAKNKHARKYAKSALKRLVRTNSPQYKPHSVHVEIGKAGPSAANTQTMQRHLNLLKTGKLKDAETVAREVYRDGFTNQQVSDALATALLKNAPGATEETSDSIAWLAKSLGNIGHARYLHTLADLQKSADLDLHVGRHIVSAMRHMPCANTEQYQLAGYKDKQMAQAKSSKPADIQSIANEINKSCFASNDVSDALMETLAKYASQQDNSYNNALTATIRALGGLGYDRYRSALTDLASNVALNNVLQKQIKTQLKSMPQTNSKQYKLGGK